MIKLLMNMDVNLWKYSKRSSPLHISDHLCDDTNKKKKLGRKMQNF